MSRRPRTWLVPCLAFAWIFFYTWLFLRDLVLQPSNYRSRLLAQDALLAACDSVHDAMLTLLETYEDGPRTVIERNANLDTKFEQLQASVDNLQRESPPRNIALGKLSSTRPVKPRHVAEIDMCRFFAGKRVTMIGGEHIYRLHVLLLQHRERAEKKLFPCPYHEFCTHHHICLAPQYMREDVPPPRYIKPPTTQELIETESAAVSYIVSDTLLSAPNKSSWEYNLPFVDPMTGVRLRETHWLATARKANVVILGRGPLSAPGQTYAGNWSFLRHIPDHVDKSRSTLAGRYEEPGGEPAYQAAPRSLEILNAAVHLTVSRFLPELFQFFQSLRREVRPSRQKQMIWPSNWYRLPGRGAARIALIRSRGHSNVQDMIQETSFRHHRLRFSAEYDLLLQLSVFIDADVRNTTHLEDLWTLLFNTQVYLQNTVLRELLPWYGIVFLPLDVPRVEDTQTRGHYSHGAVAVEAEQTIAIGEAFLIGMDYVLRYLE